MNIKNHSCGQSSVTTKWFLQLLEARTYLFFADLDVKNDTTLIWPSEGFLLQVVWLHLCRKQSDPIRSEKADIWFHLQSSTTMPRLLFLQGQKKTVYEVYVVVEVSELYKDLPNMPHVAAGISWGRYRYWLLVIKDTNCRYLKLTLKPNIILYCAVFSASLHTSYMTDWDY